MLNYDKNKIRESLSNNDIFLLLTEWGGEPMETNFGFISRTICHNTAGEGSKKLYYYFNTGLFRCFTECQDVFDIFELTIKVFKIQKNQKIDLNTAIHFIAEYFDIAGEQVIQNTSNSDDWHKFNSYDKIDNIEIIDKDYQLKIYNDAILNRFNYHVQIKPWLDEGISPEIMSLARIGYYPGGEQITIPHYDANGKLIGLRGRSLIEEDAKRFGKYRPLKINKILYNHPIGFSLYGLNWAKDNIQIFQKAIIFESEKSVLKYLSYFGVENDIAVACCGSNITFQQIQLLKDAGAKEIIVALDRQFRTPGDTEWQHLTNNLYKIKEKFGRDILISFIFDKNLITDYKDAPIDTGAENFIKLFNERILI